MKSCLRISEDTGAVSAMSVKRDSSRLLCGYSMGSVALWDLSSGELLKVYNNLHTQSITVLHLKASLCSPSVSVSTKSPNDCLIGCQTNILKA